MTFDLARRLSPGKQGDVLRALVPETVYIDAEGGEGKVLMRFAWTGEDGLPPVDSYGSFVYPSAFAGIDYSVPLVRNHDWNEIIGSAGIDANREEAWAVGRFLDDAGGELARSQMLELSGRGVRLEASISMRPSTVKLRYGADLTDAEVEALKAADFDPMWGYAIDQADVIECSWVLAGAVPETIVDVRSDGVLTTGAQPPATVPSVGESYLRLAIEAARSWEVQDG